MKASVTKTKVRKEVVVCREQVHRAYAHSKEEAMAKAKEIVLENTLQNIKMGYRPCGCAFDDGIHEPEFELPDDAWIPSSASATRCSEEMPTDFTTLPFAIPKEVEHCKKINEILRYSLRQQRDYEISDNPGPVTHLISRCLTAAGIQNRVVCGYRRTERELSESSKGSDSRLDFCLEPLAKMPHVWLVVGDHVVDNTYMKYMSPKRCRYLAKNTPHCYVEKTFKSYSSLLDCDAAAEKDPHVTRIKFCMRQPDMFLALAHNFEQFYNYFFAMIRHMYEEYGMSIRGIDPNIRLFCWWCEGYPQKGQDLYSDTFALRLNHPPADPTRASLDTDGDLEAISTVASSSRSTWRLLQCGNCMVANYCSEKCQRRDWTDNHHATCLKRESMLLPPLSHHAQAGEL